MKKQTLTSALLFAFSLGAMAQEDVDILRLSFPSTNSYEQGKPMLSPSGDELYFVSSYHATDDKVVSQNIWKTKWSDKLSELNPELIKELSNRDNNAIIGFDAKTNDAYLLGTYSRKENLKKGVSTANFSNGSFTKPEEQKIKSTVIKGELYDFHKPNNSDVMFMALPNRNDLISIYVSFPDEKNSWTKPVILSQISDENGTEISPYFDEAEGYLYFASDREGGMGGMDIYRTKKQDDTWLNWGTPELLPEPINSKSFDAYYATYGTKGSFLVSTRQDSLSSIYHIKFYEEKAMPEVTLDDDFSLEGTNEGTFKYDGLPKANAVLKLYDENGNLVEETTTNDKGEFAFSKLSPDKTYLIRHLTEDGNFDPKKASLIPFDKSKYSALKPITATMQKNGMTEGELIAGVFKYDELPKSGVEVVLLDEDGNVLNRTLTDANGYYEFDNLDPDKVYLVKYMDEDGTLDPSKLGVFPAENIFSTLKPITTDMRKDGMTEGDLIAGTFEYDGLTKDGIEVFLLDENDKILGSTFTDKNGFYKFTNLNPDKTYVVMYKDADGVFDPSLLAVFPAEAENTAEVPNATPVEPVKPAEPVKPETPVKPTIPVKPTEPVKTEKPATPKAAEPINMSFVLHFETKEIDPKDPEWLELKEQLKGLDKGIRLKIEGHADNVGSESSNQQLALERAQNTKKMLVSLGFNADLLSVSSAGELNPIATNNTPEGRAKNRRVVISLK